MIQKQHHALKAVVSAAQGARIDSQLDQEHF